MGDRSRIFSSKTFAKKKKKSYFTDTTYDWVYKHRYRNTGAIIVDPNGKNLTYKNKNNYCYI